jgi:major membrane immunogen (membrane-anchored lipoprotein)
LLSLMKTYFMRKRIYSGILLAFILLAIISCASKSNYRSDGVFEGRSRSKYTSEPFVAISRVHIEKGIIRKIDFQVIDTLNNELFDDKYENHFIGNNEYINQCRNDWNGILRYPDELVRTQEMDSVDAVSGATWSYNMFKSSTEIALSKAKQ